MGIRKYGAATGEVTGVEQDGITRQAARREDWGPDDDRDLAAENQAVDQAPGDDD